MGSEAGEASNRLYRRELLALLAGVPVAGLVGCNSGRAFSFEGELLNPDFSILHRIRDGWRPQPAEQDPAEHRAVIVGGGMSGLSAAWRLEQLGIEDYVVLELGREPGGTAMSGTAMSGQSSGRAEEFRFPWGAHYVPTPMRENSQLIELFHEMGVVTGMTDAGDPVVAEEYLCRDPEERVFSDGRWSYGLYPGLGANESDLEQVKRFRQLMTDWATRKDSSGRRMFAIPMESGSDEEVVRKLDQQSMSDWMTVQGFDSTRLTWLVDYGCRDDYGLSIDQTSAWAGIFYFASRLRDGASESQAVITWPEGNGRIVDYLASRCKDKLKCSHAVTSIRESDSGKLQIEAIDTDAERGVSFVADHVVFASPQFVGPHVIERWKASQRDIGSFKYGGWVVGNIHLRDRPIELSAGMSWDNVIGDGQSLGYVTSTHQTGRDHGPTVLTWYHPMLDDDPRVSRAELLRLTWDDWSRVIVSDLSKAHPDIESLIDRIDIMRWGHAMIQPRVGFVWGGQRRNASKSLGNIHFAGTDLSGVALMEEAFYRGSVAAQKCVETTS